MDTTQSNHHDIPNASGVLKQPLKCVRVVAALIWRQGELLVQQRSACSKFFPGLWEFPGGKVEPFEDDLQALMRECLEELAVAINVHHLAWRSQQTNSECPIDLWFYHATLQDEQQQPQALAAEQLAWLKPDALQLFSFCPADRAMLDKLIQGELGLDKSTIKATTIASHRGHA